LLFQAENLIVPTPPEGYYDESVQRWVGGPTQHGNNTKTTWFGTTTIVVADPEDDD